METEYRKRVLPSTLFLWLNLGCDFEPGSVRRGINPDYFGMRASFGYDCRRIRYGNTSIIGGTSCLRDIQR